MNVHYSILVYVIRCMPILMFIISVFGLIFNNGIFKERKITFILS